MDISGENARGKTDGGWAFMYILCLSDVKEMNLNRVRKEREWIVFPNLRKGRRVFVKVLIRRKQGLGKNEKGSPHFVNNMPES